MDQKPTSFLVTILVFQLALYFSVFLNITVARQIIGFFYLTFIPGYILLKLLNQNNLSHAEIIVFSVGLSISILMLVGLITNEVGYFVGLEKPLGLTPIIIAISMFVILGSFICWLKRFGNCCSIENWFSTEITKGMIVKFAFLLIAPILTIIGAYWSNLTGSTSIFLLALVAILVIFAIAVFWTKMIPPKFYSLIICIIAITLLFQFSLTSNYVQGADIKNESYVFNLVHENEQWNSAASFGNLIYGRFYNMLSITVLPNIFSNVLGLTGTWVFKILFPLVFAFVPLALYLLWRDRFGVSIAFFSVFLFMSQVTFYIGMLQLARQMIAELFFALLFLVLLSKKLSSRNMKLLFVIFSFSLVVSHYSMALIFFFTILIVAFAAIFYKKIIKNLTPSLIILFAVLMFSWYLFTTVSATITDISTFGEYVYTGLGNFFNVSSRGQGVLQGIGLSAVPQFLNIISRIVGYITEIFIALGFLILILQRKKRPFDSEYVFYSLGSVVILAMTILLPNFALTLDILRFYHVVLFLLAPFFAIGCLETVRFAVRKFGSMKKSRTKLYSFILITLLLGTYFLFQTNFVYEATGSISWSLPLSRYRLGSRLYTDLWYTTKPDVNGAEWLSQNGYNKSMVCGDLSVYYSLISYGRVNPALIRVWDNFTVMSQGELVVIGELNTIYGEAILSGPNVENTTGLINSENLNLIYTNAYLEVYEETSNGY